MTCSLVAWVGWATMCAVDAAKSIGKTPGCGRPTGINVGRVGSRPTMQLDGTGDEPSARQLYEAACDLALIGDTERAIAHFGSASQLAVAAPNLLADIALVAGQAIGWHRSPIEALGSLHTAATYAPDPSTSSVCLAHAAMFAMLAGDVPHALEIARRAVDLAPPTDPVATLVSSAVHGWQLLLVGDPSASTVLHKLVCLAPTAAT